MVFALPYGMNTSTGLRMQRLTFVVGLLMHLTSGALAQEQGHATQVQGIACVLGTHGGIAKADSETIASLVCSELRSAGVAVSGPHFVDVQASELYRIELHKLGSIKILKLIHESPQGTPQASREIELARIEEARVAAPRIVQALVHNESMEQTRTVENLVHTETVQPPMIDSEFFFGLGLASAVAVGAPGFSEGYGVEIILQHQSPHWAMGGHARFLGSDEFVMANFNLGARYFILDTNISPFFGGGLGLYALAVDSSDVDGGGGLGAQLEAGVELMRFHSSRLGAAFRVDLPFFDLADASNLNGNRYIVPVGIQLYYLF